MLVRYSQGKGLKGQKPTKKLVLETFIEMGVKHNIFEADWIEKLLLENERIKEHAEAGSSCGALATSVNEEKKDDYRCVWFREDRPPQVRKLGNTKEMKDAACSACKKTGEIIEGLKARDERILKLETELGAKSSERLKIPKCNRGAILNHDKEDNLIFNNCFKHRGEPVSVDKFCRVYSNGLPCSMFAFLVVGVEGRKIE